MASILKVDELQYSDGSPFELGSAPPTIQTFTTSGTWTKPSGCKTIKVTVIGGGGGAGGVTNGQRTCGGGAGGYGELFLDVTSISSVAVTVGAGGVGGADGYTDGTSGGTSSFGTHITATGGGGTQSAVGANKYTYEYHATGGTCTGGYLNVTGATTYSTAGTFYFGASSQFGMGGKYYNGEANGEDGAGYGTGGAGVYSGSGTFSGGSGKHGIVIVEEFY